MVNIVLFLRHSVCGTDHGVSHAQYGIVVPSATMRVQNYAGKHGSC